MPVDGQRIITEYRDFKITLQYFREDPYHKPDEVAKKKKRKKNETVGWSFGIYGVIDRSIHIYTAWSHSAFSGASHHLATRWAENMIDDILAKKKNYITSEVSIIEMPKIRPSE